MPQNVELGPLTLRIKPDVGSTLSALRGVQSEVNRLQMASSRLALAVTTPITIAAGAALKAFSDFDDAMTASLSIYGKVTADIRSKMESTARAISERTRTTATEIAKGYGVLISAGFDLEQSMQAIAVAEKFAIAGFMELGQAATFLAQSQSALGLSFSDPIKNMQQTQRVADVLSMANAKAAGSIEQFARALASKGAPALRAANKSLEEGVAALMVYAKNGRHAEIAGELLNVTLRELDTVSRKFSANWRRFGVAIYDSRGNMRKLWEILGDMEKRLASMSPQAKAATLSFLGFTDLSSTAIKSLLGESELMKEFYENLQNSAGKTAQIAADRLKSFASQLKITWNQIVGVGIDVGGILAPALGVVNEYLRHGIKLWKSLSDEQKKFAVAAVAISAALSPAVKLMDYAFRASKMLILGVNYVFKLALIPLQLYLSTYAIRWKLLTGLWNYAKAAAEDIAHRWGWALRYVDVGFGYLMRGISEFVSGVAAAGVAAGKAFVANFDWKKIRAAAKWATIGISADLAAMRSSLWQNSVAMRGQLNALFGQFNNSTRAVRFAIRAAWADLVGHVSLSKLKQVASQAAGAFFSAWASGTAGMPSLLSAFADLPARLSKIWRTAGGMMLRALDPIVAPIRNLAQRLGIQLGGLSRFLLDAARFGFSQIARLGEFAAESARKAYAKTRAAAIEAYASAVAAAKSGYVAVLNFASAVGLKLVSAWHRTADAIKNIGPAVRAAIAAARDALAGIGQIYRDIAAGLADTAKELAAGVRRMAATVASSAMRVMSVVMSAAKSLGATVAFAAMSVLSAVASAAGRVAGVLSQAARRAASAVASAASASGRALRMLGSLAVEAAVGVWGIYREIGVGVYTLVKDAAKAIVTAVAPVIRVASAISRAVLNSAAAIVTALTPAFSSLVRGIRVAAMVAAEFGRFLASAVGDVARGLYQSAAAAAAGILRALSPVAHVVANVSRFIADSFISVGQAIWSGVVVPLGVYARTAFVAAGQAAWVFARAAMISAQLAGGAFAEFAKNLANRVRAGFAAASEFSKPWLAWAAEAGRKAVDLLLPVGRMAGRAAAFGGKMAAVILAGAAKAAGVLGRTGGVIAFRVTVVGATIAAATLRATFAATNAFVIGVSTAASQALRRVGQSARAALGAVRSVITSTQSFTKGAAAGQLESASKVAGLIESVTSLLTQWPILLAAAGGAAWYAFVRFTDTGRKAFEAVASFAKPATDVIVKAFSGVKNALAGGDLALAWEITTTSIQLATFSMLESIYGDADNYLGTIATKLVKGDFAGAWNTVLLEIGAQFDALWSSSLGALSEFVAASLRTWKSAVDGLTNMIIDADVTGTFKRQKEEATKQSAEMIAILERQKAAAEAALQVAVGAGDADEIAVQQQLISEANRGIARHRNDISGYLDDVKKYAGGATSQVSNSVNAAMQKIRAEQAAIAEEGRRLAEQDQKGSGKEIAKRREEVAKRMEFLNLAAADAAKKAKEQEEAAAEQLTGLKDNLEDMDGKTYNAQIGVTGVSRAEAIATAWFSRVSEMRNKFNRGGQGKIALPGIPAAVAPSGVNVPVPKIPAIGGDGAALMGDRAAQPSGGVVAGSPIDAALKEAIEAAKAADFALESAQDNLTRASHRYNEALKAQNAAVGAQREEAAKAAEEAAGATLKAERDLEEAKKSAKKRADELVEVKAAADKKREEAPAPRGMEIPIAPIGDKAVDTMLKARDRIQAQMDRAQENANGKPIDLSRQQAQLDKVNSNIRKRMSRMNGPLKANAGVDKRINKMPIPAAGEPRVPVPLIPDMGAGFDALGSDYMDLLHGGSGIPAPTPAPVPQSTVRLEGDALAILERIATNTGKPQITLQQTEVA